MLHGHGPDHAGRAGPECRGHRLVQTLPHILCGRLHTRIPYQASVPVLFGECHQSLPLVLLRTSRRTRGQGLGGEGSLWPHCPLYIVSVSFWTPRPAACPMTAGLVPAGSGDCSVCPCMFVVCVCMCPCPHYMCLGTVSPGDHMNCSPCLCILLERIQRNIMWPRLAPGVCRGGSRGCGHWWALLSPSLGVLWSPLGFSSRLVSLPLPALLLFFEECSIHCS